MSHYRRRVIVIGAGMSGLACAKELQTRGYDVLVVEARSRVGGRLKGGAMRLEGDEQQMVDLGGALIHGIDENPLTSLARDIGVPVQPVEDCLLLDNSGWPVDPREDERISTLFNDCLEESFRRCSGEEANPVQSFGDMFYLVCKERSINVSALLSWHKTNLEVGCGASFEDLGFKWNEDEPYGFDGKHVALRHSWKVVVDALAQELAILYDAPVKRVHVIHPTPTNEEQHVQQTVATSVASSTPPATAAAPSQRPSRKKPAASSVEVVVPERQSRRLLGLDASARRSARTTKGKIVERFTVDHNTPQQAKRPRPLDDSGPRKPVVQITLQNGTVLEADFCVCTTPLGILKIAHDKTDGIVFDPPLPMAKQRAIQRLGTGLLNKCALSFPRVFWQDSDFLGLAEEDQSYLVLNNHAFTGKPILVFMYGGNYARDIEEWTDADIVEDCLQVLKRICGRQIPEPIDYRVTRWGHEQYSRMAFSYVPPGVDGFAELKAMSEPIYDHTGKVPQLMFAGEHTTPYHPSTIHGAFLSGIREAYRLDCAMFPKANDNLEFSESELYERTFAMERKFFGADSLPIRAPEQGDDATKPEAPSESSEQPKHQHRRRGASGVMKLRSRPRTASAEAPVTNGEVPVPSRRSSRASFPSKKYSTNGVDLSPNNGGAQTPAEDTKEAGRNTKQLENDTLLRSLESYGRDYDYLMNVVLPIHGSEKALAPSEVKRRCQHLLYQTKGNRPSNSAAWKRFIAKAVFPPTQVDDAYVSMEALQTAKRSSKKSKKTVSEEEPEKKPAAVVIKAVKTRSGRVVLPPSVTEPDSKGVITAAKGKPKVKIVVEQVKRVVKTRSGRASRKPLNGT